MLSGALKAMGGYGREGKKGFDGSMLRLQEQGYALIGDFVYQLDRFGRPYGWGVAEYSTPERFMGDAFTDSVYRRSPRESWGRVMDQLRSLLPRAGEQALRKLVG
mgnify:CR=1 FL=1